MNAIIQTAILHRRLLEFTYDGFHRVVEPYVFGSYKGRLQLLCYQVRGESASGKLPEWRRMNVNAISDLRMTRESFIGARPTKGISRSPFDLLIACASTVRRPKTFVLVSGVEGKRSRAVAAKDLYHSPWFRAARAYAEQADGPWFILSMEHGLLSPETRIAPYERPPAGESAEERKRWAERVFAALRSKIYPGDTVVLLAGEKLREFLEEKLTGAGCLVETPLRGLRIGEQVRWLKQQSNTAAVGETYLLPLTG